MARRQIFGFDLRAASGAIKFDDAHPERVGRETERAGHYGWMDFARIAVVEEAALLIIFAGRAELAVAAIAEPLLVVEFKIEIFGDTDSIGSRVAILPLNLFGLRRSIIADPIYD